MNHSHQLSSESAADLWFKRTIAFIDEIQQRGTCVAENPVAAVACRIPFFIYLPNQNMVEPAPAQAPAQPAAAEALPIAPPP